MTEARYGTGAMMEIQKAEKASEAARFQLAWLSSPIYVAVLRTKLGHCHINCPYCLTSKEAASMHFSR
jgi:hypothetical protein